MTDDTKGKSYRINLSAQEAIDLGHLAVDAKCSPTVLLTRFAREQIVVATTAKLHRPLALIAEHLAADPRVTPKADPLLNAAGVSKPTLPDDKARCGRCGHPAGLHEGRKGKCTQTVGNPIWHESDPCGCTSFVGGAK